MTRALIALIAFTSLTTAQQPRFRSQAEAVILNVLVPTGTGRSLA